MYINKTKKDWCLSKIKFKKDYDMWCLSTIAFWWCVFVSPLILRAYNGIKLNKLFLWMIVCSVESTTTYALKWSLKYNVSSTFRLKCTSSWIIKMSCKLPKRGTTSSSILITIAQGFLYSMPLTFTHWTLRISTYQITNIY